MRRTISSITTLSLLLLMLTTVFSCSSDSNSDSNAGKQSIINNLKTHKWFTSSTIFEVDTEEFYASFDKDSRLVYFLTDTTGVNIYKGSGASTDGNSYKRLDYKYFKYEIQDDVVVMRNEDNTSDRMVYHKDFLEGKNGAHNLEALPLSHDSKFISEHAKLAHVHLLSSDERIKNIGKVEVTLLNTSSSGSKNWFNVQVTTKGEEYLLERQITSLRMYVKCSTYLYNTTTSETKVYGIVDNNKLSRTELYPIETSRSEIKLTITLSAYDAKNQKRYFLVESKEVTISKDGKVEVKDDGTNGDNDKDEPKEPGVITDYAFPEGLSVTLGGTAVGIDKSTRVGFIYGTEPDLSSTKGTKVYTTVTSDGQYEQTISDLKCGTTYYYRAYAYANSTYLYGDVQEFTTYDGYGEANGHKWVDLGLPSGTKWAIDDMDDRYQWGMTEPYTPNQTYAHYAEDENGNGYVAKYSTNKNYGVNDGLTQLELEDDAAYMNWGQNWCIPTRKQQNELRSKCTWKWNSSAKQYVVTGPSGNSITFDLKYNSTTSRDYWSSTLISTTLHEGDCISAYTLQMGYMTGYTPYQEHWSFRKNYEYIRPVLRDQ